jgi:hypothetical protein
MHGAFARWGREWEGHADRHQNSPIPTWGSENGVGGSDGIQVLKWDAASMTIFMDLSLKRKLSNHICLMLSNVVSLTAMAETYEYPPSLANYRPLQFDRTGIYPVALRLRHHFFLTRIKIVFKEVMGASNDVRVDWFFQEELVRFCNNKDTIHLSSMQQNVLISQGWCAALGVSVPTPFFLQELLLGNFDDPDRAHRLVPSLVKLFVTLEISDIDRMFHDDIMGDAGRWWLHPTERPLSFREMWRMLEKRTDDVGSHFLSGHGSLRHGAACQGRLICQKTMGGH